MSREGIHASESKVKAITPQAIAYHFWTHERLPKMAASRLQRWAIILSPHTYKIAYKPTKEHGNADCLSQLPQEIDIEFEKIRTLESVISLIQEAQLKCLPLSPDRVREEKEKNNHNVLSKVLLKTH